MFGYGNDRILHDPNLGIFCVQIATCDKCWEKVKSHQQNPQHCVRLGLCVNCPSYGKDKVLLLIHDPWNPSWIKPVENMLRASRSRSKNLWGHAIRVHVSVTLFLTASYAGEWQELLLMLAGNISTPSSLEIHFQFHSSSTFSSSHHQISWHLSPVVIQMSPLVSLINDKYFSIQDITIRWWRHASRIWRTKRLKMQKIDSRIYLRSTALQESRV